MINFCTLFDSNYLTRAIAMNESLARVCPSYHLYVVAFDDDSYNYLVKAAMPSVTPISLKEFEDRQLLAVKPSRSPAEYCWTCTPSVILYCIEKFHLPSCTYIDADMLFYHDPQVLLDEMGNLSVIITEHRYTKEYEKVSIDSGIYCVQFMFFKNDTDGMTALKWWRERCLEWCYARQENGKYGDQKYLDDWPERFPGVHVMQHPGGGVAPWNVQQYTFVMDEGAVILIDRTGRRYPLVFFHFQGVKFYTDGMASLSGTIYDMADDVKNVVYFPYLKKLLEIASRLPNEGTRVRNHGARAAAPGKWQLFRGWLKEVSLLLFTGSIPPFKLKNYNFSRHYHFYRLDNL